MTEKITQKIENVIQSIDEILEKIKNCSEDFNSNSEIFSTLADLSPAGIYLYQDRKFVYINKATERISGYSIDELKKMEPMNLLHPDDYKTVEKIIERRERGEKLEAHHYLRIKHKNGEYRDLYVVSNTVTYKGRPAGIGIALDITEQKDLQKKLAYLSSHDELTGLYNRNFLLEELKELIKLARSNHYSLAFLHIDINKFKEIINLYGHATGDYILKITGQQLKKLLKEDDVIGRLSGDEFGVIIPKLEKIEAVSKITEKIISSIEKPITLKDKEISLTASIGITIYPYDGKTAEDLIKNAEIAMNHAKNISNKENKSKYMFFSYKLGKQIEEKIKLKELLKTALEKNKDEFILYYQPIVNLQTGKLKGFEALVRWENKKFGTLPSEKFIQIAEETGEIINLGKLIIEKAINHIQIWKEKGFDDFKITINISSEQLKSEDFIKFIEETTKNLPQKDRVTLEITESILIQNVEKTRKILNKLKDLGFSIAIDDFGTGYSSLNYLKEFPFDFLKIDKSFLSDILNNKKTKAIVLSIIELSHNLQSKAVIEGIETEEQAKLLKDLNCDYGQGYYFSKPLLFNKVENLLKNPYFQI